MQHFLFIGRYFMGDKKLRYCKNMVNSAGTINFLIVEKIEKVKFRQIVA
jgi:hypothetical protein